MKTRFTHPGRAEGHALLMVLCITTATMIVLAATMNRTIGTSTMNARNSQYLAGLYAAEAATEKVFAMMKSDFLAGNLTFITNHMSLYKGAIPTSTEDAYWGKYQFSDGQGNLNSNFVGCTMSQPLWGALRSQYAGLYGWTNVYRVISNVKQVANTRYDITSTCQQEIELDLIPCFSLPSSTTACSNSPGAPRSP